MIFLIIVSKYFFLLYPLSGPGMQTGVRISGTDVSETLTSFPATISFPINDDDAAVEAVERYFLTLIPSDPAISINPATTEIVILDDDSKQQNMH